ncbi:dachshund homolog 1-like [Lytechinus pictus]|uniref:dachshund homolog 1-like n=1 Tax=Lytechinus pictus TaxID=7653 RepID=UPI0030B9FD36
MASGNKFDELRKKFSAEGVGNPGLGLKSPPPPPASKNVNLGHPARGGGVGGGGSGGGGGGMVTRGGGAFGYRGNSSNSTGPKLSSSQSQPTLPSLPSRTQSQSSSSSDISDIPPVTSPIAGYSKKALPARVISQPPSMFRQSEAHIEEDMYTAADDEDADMNGDGVEDELYMVDLDDNDPAVSYPPTFYMCCSLHGEDIESKSAVDINSNQYNIYNV